MPGSLLDIAESVHSSPSPPLPPGPYRSSQEHLEDGLALVALLLERHIGRFGHRVFERAGELIALREELAAVVSPNLDVVATTAERLGWRSPEVVDMALAAHRERVQRRLDATVDAELSTWLPIEELRARGHLSERQLDLLLAAAAPSMSVALDRVFAAVGGDPGRHGASPGLLAELVSPDGRCTGELLGEFGRTAPLRARRLLELRDVASHGSPTPLLHCAVHVPDDVVLYLMGRRGQGAGWGSPFHRIEPASQALALSDVVAAEGVVERLRSALRWISGRPGGEPLVLQGPRGVGRRTLLGALLTEIGVALVVVDLDELAIGAPELLERTLTDAFRQGTLGGAALLLRADRISNDRDLWGRVGWRTLELLAGWDSLVCWLIDTPIPWIARAVSVDFDTPDAADQERVWRVALAEARVEDAEGLAHRMARQLSMTPGRIQEAASAAVQEVKLRPAGRRGPLTEHVLTGAVRQQLHHDLGHLCDPLTTRLGWNDIVLPEDVRQQLGEILAHARQRHTVLDVWGLRRHMAYGLGLSCLFSGPPGTGKTLLAMVLANELEQELYRVDLSRVVSKWVGETEQNLARVFEEAERGRVILLFDEADSLFSKRTRVNSAQERYANMEINYLLQRMEAYPGITILTTNNERGIDEAFMRRIRFRLYVPLPDATLRARLWRGLLPPGAPLDPSIAFEVLGRDFEFSGGHIRNAVLRAAVRAADAGEAIRMEHLYEAALAEARELGQVVRDKPREQVAEGKPLDL